MPELLTSLPEYSFTQTEHVEARIFSPLQVCYFQTLLARSVYERSNVDLDPEHPLLFVQAEAYRKACIDIYQGLLDGHHEAQAQLKIINSQNGDFISSEFEG